MSEELRERATEVLYKARVNEGLVQHFAVDYEDLSEKRKEILRAEVDAVLSVVAPLLAEKDEHARKIAESAADSVRTFVAELAEKDAEIAALKVELLRRGVDHVEGGQYAIPHRCIVGVATDPRVARAPHVWHAGDPEPHRDVRFTDCHGDEWRWSESRGEWVTPETAGCSWEHIAKKWSPLTEVVSDGD